MAKHAAAHHRSGRSGPEACACERARHRLAPVEVIEFKELIGGVGLSDLVPSDGPDWEGGYLHRKLVSSEENVRRDKSQCLLWLE